VSLIESVFEKMRRAGVEPEGAASRAAVPLHDALRAEPEYDHRHIAVDLAKLQAAGYLPEKEEERRLADHYRQIKRPLIEQALAPGAAADMRLILVTSPLPGDGKTFTSINLAMSFARERDTSALLIDADLPKAHISRAFGLENERGLVDALQDDALEIESLILRTDVRGLDILPAGKWTEGMTELITSSRMSQIAARIAARNPRRLTLLDSSPLLVSIEARALVQIPGQIVLVVRAGKTPRQAVLDAISHLDKQKLRGLVLNDAHSGSASGYYQYSYYGAPDDGTSPRS
jgi:protein-tyrosine kinase